MEAQALLDQIAALAPAAEPREVVTVRARASGVQAAVSPPAETPRKIAEGTTPPGTHAPVASSASGAGGSKASRKRRSKKNKQAAKAVATPAPAPVAQPEAQEDLEVEIEIVATPAPPRVTDPIGAAVPAAPIAVPRVSRKIPVVAAPTLTIDDDDPDSAERTREAREPKEPSRRSFLPPILLDEERSGRQGGLTLAVIILLIVATLTLSYLMRRPNASGEGVSSREPSSFRVA